jgi:hypothetical protein
MDEALERLIDTVVVRENVTRERAELIVWGLLEELRRLLDEHPARIVKITVEDDPDLEQEGASGGFGSR